MKLLRRRPPRCYHSLSDNVRETLVLLRQFRGVVLLFSLTVIGGGWLCFSLSLSTLRTHPTSLTEAVFLVLSMTSLQVNAEFPGGWYVQIFFSVMPALGLSILSQGGAAFSVLLFS